jgi:general secretion pathway protein C
MVGYRVSPGRDAEQFRQLGFEAGDVVTSINGVSLDNPTNTMVLYNSLRTAGEVVFEIKRGDQPLSLSVNLDGGAEQ